MDDPVHYFRISDNLSLPDLRERAPFRAVIVLNSEYRNDWQHEVSRWLVESGCLYMMAWGPNCTTWDDSVDYAQIQKFLPDEAPDEEFVMTTWHDDETLEEVFWFAEFCAYDPYDKIRNTLILDVSETDRSEELLGLYEQSKTLHREAS